MTIVKAFFGLPVPLLASFTVFVPEEGQLLTEGPEWFIGFIAAIALIGYFLKLAGKFPGMNGERRSDDSIERMIKIAMNIEETRDELKEMRGLLIQVAGHLNTIAQNSVRRG